MRKRGRVSVVLHAFFQRLRGRTRLPLIAVFVAEIFSKTNPLFSKQLLEHGWSPQALYLAVLLLMTIVLAAHEFASLEHGGRWQMDRRDVLGTVLTALTGGILSPLLFFAGLQSMRASDAVLVTSLQPLFIVCFAVLLLGDRFRRETVLGGALLIAGIAVLFWRDLLAFHVAPGALLLLGSSLTSALTTIIHKKLVTHRHLDSVVLVRSFVSLLAVAAWVAVSEPAAFTLLVDPPRIWSLLGLALLSFLVPYFLYYRALPHVSTIDVGLVVATGPAIGVLLASAFLGEQIQPVQIASLALIGAGIISINVPITNWRIVPSRVVATGPLQK